MIFRPLAFLAAMVFLGWTYAREWSTSSVVLAGVIVVVVAVDNAAMRIIRVVRHYNFQTSSDLVNLRFNLQRDRG